MTLTSPNIADFADTCFEDAAFEASDFDLQRSIATGDAGDSRAIAQLSGRLHTAEVGKPDWYSICKRAIDVAGAGAGLIALAIPLMLVWIAVKLTSSGPAIFKQERYGRDQRLFTIYKFRTLNIKNENRRGVEMDRLDDGRLTPIGKFLRSTSLDELPQLWNVVRGDMSLVGPRPHVPDMHACGVLYEELVPTYSLRHSIRPGLTGLAQVFGYRGPVDTYDRAAGRIAYDLDYVCDWSPMLDIQIILKTVGGSFLTRDW